MAESMSGILRPSSRFALQRFGAKVSSMPMTARVLALLTLLALASSCRGDDTNIVRGKGMTAADTLSAPDRARIYEAAVRGAFELDASLSLLLDPRLLPRDVGLAADGRIPETVIDEMKRRGTIRGTCEPGLQGINKGVPHCTAASPGYIVRYSPVFELGPDSMQVYIYVQKYDTPKLEPSQGLRFERAYQVVRRGTDWRAVREARVPREIRGEPRR